MTAEAPPDTTHRELHRAKLAMRRHLLEVLYAPFRQRFIEGVDELVARNTEIGKFSHAGFRFAGARYGADWSPRSRIPLPTLLPEFQPTMLALVREQRYIDHTERPYIEATLSALLARSVSVTQFRTFLPEALHRAVTNAPGQCWWAPETARQDLKLSWQTTHVEHGLQLLRERLVKNLIDL